MITVSQDVVRALNASATALYNDFFQAQTGAWTEIASLLPSTLPTEEYAWLGDLPIMREWTDERRITALREFGFSLTNRKFEMSVGIARELIEDERHGMIKMKIASLAEATNAHYDQILFEAINANRTAYDGNTFYHIERGNLGSTALSADSLAGAITALRKQKGHNGEPLDVRPTHLLVPPELEWQARQILSSAYYPGATGTGKPGALAQNVLQNALRLVVSPRLATGTEFHVLDCSRSMRPFLIQQRIAPEFTAQDDPSGEVAFMRDEFRYGVRSRDAAGGALPHLAYKSTGTD
jgi:phage major head subunit gpT-like protein